MRPDAQNSAAYNTIRRLMQFSVERLQHVFDSLEYHVAMFDREWRFTYVNLEAAALLGRSADELRGRCVWELFPEAVGNEYLTASCTTRWPLDASSTAITLSRRSTGCSSIRSIRSLKGCWLLARDVTVERQTAEAQRARETMLRLAQRAGGIGVFDWDLAAGTARCSAEFFAMFGLPELEGSMTADQWNRYLHPLDRERMTAHLARALEGVEPAAADYRILTEDGRTRWLTYSGQLHRTPAGHLRLLGTVLDITARKDAEEELRQARRALPRVREHEQ